MPYSDTIDSLATRAASKATLAAVSPRAYLVGAILAGAYVGFGVALIFTLGSQAPIELQKLVMGATFGIALTLVVFAGSELFTGHALYMVLGLLSGRCSLRQLGIVWSLTWLGNLVGSVMLAALLALGVGGDGSSLGADLLHRIAEYKMESGALSLVARGITCNWLICLALWMGQRTSSDAARCILISWCLLAFIALGLEHCVANMMLLSLNILLNDLSFGALAGSVHNVAWVTLGNTIGGAVFVGLAYWLASTRQKDVEAHS